VSLIVGETTYISATDAATYLASVYLSTDAKLAAWTALSSADKDVALRNACKVLDRQPYVGFKSTTTQALEFPRILYTEVGLRNTANVSDAVYFRGDELYDSGIVPDAVKYAQCEIALEVAQGTTDAQSRAELRRSGVKSFSFGKLSESYSGGGSDIISHEAKKLLAPFLAGAVRIV